MPHNSKIIQEIIVTGQRLRAGGLVCAASGNISCRIDGDSLLITASGVDKGNLTQADILFLDFQGRIVTCSPPAQIKNKHSLKTHNSKLKTGLRSRPPAPSSETPLHVALYQACPRIQAIIHAHPPYATALATAARELDWQMLEEARLFLGPVPLLPPLPAGSVELANAAARAAAGANALLLAGHGAVSWGETLDQAMFRMEILEHTARVMLYVKGIRG